MARATRMSASAWSACKPGADVLAHVDVGDVDRDDLEGGLRVEPAGQHGLGDAVGLASTSRCDSAEPMALTMPSPTRAMIVSSVAPPINCFRFARTVTRALTFSWMPFLATPSSDSPAQAAGRAVDHLGIDAGLHGLQHVAAGQVDGRGQLEVQLDSLALWAAMIERITSGTLPPAR